jgi:hypothetical protein
MKISFEEKKAEAVKRMRLIKLLPNIIAEFKKDNTVHYSERCGILYWLSNEPEWEEYVRKFEEKYGALVYHAELSHLEFGRCLSLLYVGDEKDKWTQDAKDLAGGYAFCYVWNIDDPDCSEFGTIGFKPIIGGIRRTA